MAAETEKLHCNVCGGEPPEAEFYGYNRTLCKTCRRVKNHVNHVRRMALKRKQIPSKVPAGWGWI